MNTSPKPRVLIVDDDRYVAKAMTRLVKRFAEPVVASSVDEAERLLQENSSFSLILCDLLLPDRSGVELVRIVESRHPELRHRVAFMTGLGDDAEEASEFSDVPCFGKPVDVDRIRALLGGGQQASAAASTHR